MVRRANRFKGPAHLKAVKSWADLYLIQLHTQLCYPYSLQRWDFLRHWVSLCSCACAGDTCRFITHLPITMFLTHTNARTHAGTHTRTGFLFRRHPRSLNTLPLRSHLNQVRINHCHGLLSHGLQWATRAKGGGEETNRDMVKKECVCVCPCVC